MPERSKKTERVRNTPQSPKSERSNLFRELMSGVEALRAHREGRLTPRSHEAAPLVALIMNSQLVRETRES